ncbi:hypothetical protein FOZ63_013326, partial [Perkinsus olseni]
IASGGPSQRGLSAYLQRWYLNKYVDSIFGQYFEGSPEAAIPRPSSHKMVEVARPVASPSVVARVAKLLYKAKRPVIVVGSQAAQDVAHLGQLREALILLQVPVWVSGMCRGLFGTSSNSPQMVHMRGAALKEADLVIIAGTPLDFRLNYGRSVNAKATLVVCNSNKDLLKKNSDMRAANQYLHGCPSHFLRDLAMVVTRKSRKPAWPEWTATCREREAQREKEIVASGVQQSGQEDRVNPVRLLKALDKLLQRCGAEATIVADGGDFVGTAS